MTRSILHVTTFVHPDRFGGAERVVFDLARSQAAAGDRVTILTGDHDGRPDREVRDGVEFVRYPVGPRRGISFHVAVAHGVRRALAAMPAAKIDVVHAHQVASALPALAWSQRRGLATVFSFYAPWHEEERVQRQGASPPSWSPASALSTWIHRRRDRSCLDRAGRVIVLSGFSLRQVAALAPEAAGRTDTVPPGVDIDRFHPGDRAAARARLGLPAGDPVIVTVRRLYRRMGLDLLIRSMSAVVEGLPAARLLVAGTGPEREALERLATTLGVADRVRFLGRTGDDELPDLYRAADLFALPTRALEGFGMATLEALACGTPVLGTAVGATPDLLGDLQPEIEPVEAAPAALAQGIVASLRRDDLARIGRRASERVVSRYTWPRCAAEVEEVYRRAREGRS